MIEGIEPKDILAFIAFITVPAGIGYMFYRMRKSRKEAEERKSKGL